MNNQKKAPGMRLIAKQLLVDFKQRYSEAANWIDRWVADVEGSIWKTPQDIKNRYSSVSFVDNTVIFNVKGNHYRLEVKINYPTANIIVIWAGNHQDYDKRNTKR